MRMKSQKNQKKEAMNMTTSLEMLVEQARKVQMSEPQKFEQRVSFAYGTAKIENDDVTREMVQEAAKAAAS